MHHLKWYNYRTRNNLNPTGPGKTRKYNDCIEIVLEETNKKHFSIYLIICTRYKNLLCFKKY